MSRPSFSVETMLTVVVDVVDVVVIVVVVDVVVIVIVDASSAVVASANFLLPNEFAKIVRQNEIFAMKFFVLMLEFDRTKAGIT